MRTLLRRPRIATTLLLAVVAVLATVAALWPRTSASGDMTTLVRKGTLAARLTATGVLKPAQSITYRSPLGGREAEIIFLVSEGTRVNEGDLLVRLDTSDLVRELERTAQEIRQAQRRSAGRGAGSAGREGRHRLACGG